MENSPPVMIRTLGGATPKIAATAYIDPSAQVIGDVIVGEGCSIWPNATVRGDVHSIRIGNETNVQDNAVLHVDGPKSETGGFALHIGNRVTIGHAVVLHGCTVEDDALIGIGAIVLNGAKIGQGAVIAAGALIPEGMEVPAGMLAMGVPAKVRREVTPEERERFVVNARHYVKLGEKYKKEQQ